MSLQVAVVFVRMNLPTSEAVKRGSTQPSADSKADDAIF